MSASFSDCVNQWEQIRKIVRITSANRYKIFVISDKGWSGEGFCRGLLRLRDCENLWFIGYESFAANLYPPRTTRGHVSRGHKL